MKNNFFTQSNPHLALLSFVFYPFIVFAIVGLYLIPFRVGYLKEIIGFGFFSLLFYCIFLLVNSGKIRKWWLLFSCFSLSTIVFIKITFYYFYSVKITSSAVFLVLETNINEASEYLSTYINGFVIITFIVAFIPVFYLLKSFFIGKNKSSILEVVLNIKLKSYRIKIIYILLFIISSYMIYWKFRQENFLFSIAKSYKEYKETKLLLKNNLAKPESGVLINVVGLDQPQTYVVIIGESTSKWHMQIYGYGRKTNPLLTEIKNELFVFADVITPNVHTITAIEKILTLSDAKIANKKENGSVIQLANQAGFKTYWISNQKPVGYYESIPTLIGSAAKIKKFIATDNYNYDIYDESLLPFIEKALQEKHAKKIIFIHLIGTHVSYHKRYPKKYNVFNNEFDKLMFKHKKAIEYVNTYDNAVLYNDYIVRSIIEKVRKKDINGYVLYFSDHGDEVFDTIDFIGHNEYHGTKPMYEVPFVLWLSEKYKKNNPSYLTINSMLDRKYSLENFIHSFSDLSLIKFDSLNLSKSIFNSNFIYRPRIIKKNINYDSD